MSSGLPCGVPGCSHVVRAMTGFQEVEKLQRHMRKAHGVSYTMMDALTLRNHYEDKAATPENTSHDT